MAEPVRTDSPPADSVASLLALYNSGRYAEAEPQALALTQQYPSHAFGWKLLGAVLKQLGRAEEALAPMRQAAALDSSDAEAHNNLGVTLKELGRLAEAEASYRLALAARPDLAQALSNLGHVLTSLGRPEEALDCGQRAVALQPGLAAAHNNLGITLKALDSLEEAAHCFRQALAIAPGMVKALSNLASVLAHLGRPDEALERGREALALQPDSFQAHDNLLFALNYHPDKSAEEVFAAYQDYERVFGQPLRATWAAHGRQSRKLARRLRIGYVSPDFREHAMRRFLQPVLEHHDKQQVEVWAYAEYAAPDAATARYQALVDHWVPTLGLSDEALARRIQADGIDILVDLAGHSAGNRLGVFARKPAPLSVSWLGYGYTTGLRAIDYLLTDAVCAPADSEHLFSETPWRLQPVSLVYRPADGMGDVSPLPAAQRGHVTFGSLTRAIRLNHRVVRAWSAILQRVPGARLVIDSKNYRDPAMRQQLQAQFAAHGIAPERLSIGFHSPPWDTLRGIDIALDCFPHNSGTTLLEGLYMGLPYVTLAGRPGVGRLGASFLHGVGLDDWVAPSEQAYVDIAVAKAADLPSLATTRSGLRQRLRASALMDEAGFTRRLEAAYRQMWEHHGADPAAPAPPTSPLPPGSVPQSTEQMQHTLDALAALYQARQYAQAEPLARQWCGWQPESPQAWKTWGQLLKRTGRLAEAAPALQRAVALAPQDPQALGDLADVQLGLDQLQPAEATYRRALQLQPRSAELLGNLGAVLLAQARARDALEPLREALAIRPDQAVVHNNLGNALKNLGQLTEAEASYRRALALQPHLAQVHNNLAVALQGQGRYDEAAQQSRQALALHPAYPDALCNLGNALKASGSLLQAQACYEQALQHDPRHPVALNNLGVVLGDLGQHAAAQQALRAALQLRPGYLEAQDNLLFTLNYDPDLEMAEVFAAYQAYGRRFSRGHTDTPPARPPAGAPHEGPRRLRVGYVSPDLRRHSSRHFLEPLLAHHDKRAVEVFAYAELTTEDATSARYKALVDHWVPTAGLDDDALAQRIRDDGIDILVDLAGHTRGNRLPVFARKPAPVAVSWLGFGYTTGLAQMDYFLADAHTVPAGDEAWYSETPWRLDGPAFVYRPAQGMGEAGPLPALARGAVTFGTLTRAVRINARSVSVWSNILHRVPGSRLVVDSADFRDPAMQRIVVAQFGQHGIAPERLQVGYHSPPWDTLRGIDITLDCFPHNSGTTLFESLYMGVPFVTLSARAGVGRLGGAILHGAGHPEWVAPDENVYAELAVKLARDLPALAATRAQLRQQLQCNALMDEAAFARRVETAYRLMLADRRPTSTGWPGS